jgi:PIF1-like helicase
MISSMVLNLISGDSNHCSSADFVHEDEAVTHPVEFVNTLQLSGICPHDLELKTGQFARLLRNLNPSRGLSNGSRIQLLSMSRCKLIEGKYTGFVVMIQDYRLLFTGDSFTSQVHLQ